MFLKILCCLAVLALLVTWLGAKAARRRATPPSYRARTKARDSRPDDWTEGDEPPEAA